MNRLHPLALLALITTAPVVAQDGPRRPRTEPHRPHDIGATFRTKCQTCHTVPDARSTFDLAWLDQVNRTS